MDYQLRDIEGIKTIRGGLVLDVGIHGHVYVTEEQFICLYDTLRYITENYGKEVNVGAHFHRDVKPEFLIFCEDRIQLPYPWEENAQETLEKEMLRIDKMLGFYYRESEFIYIPPADGQYTPNALLVAIRRAAQLSLDIGFIFRRPADIQWVELGHLRRFVPEEVNEPFDSIEPFDKQPGYLAQLADLLGGVTETNSLPETGFDLRLACGLGQLTLGVATKDDLKAIQRKLMK